MFYLYYIDGALNIEFAFITTSSLSGRFTHFICIFSFNILTQKRGGHTHIHHMLAYYFIRQLFQEKKTSYMEDIKYIAGTVRFIKPYPNPVYKSTGSR